MTQDLSAEEFFMRELDSQDARGKLPSPVSEMLVVIRNMRERITALESQAAPQETTTDAPACEHHWPVRGATEASRGHCGNCGLWYRLAWVPAGSA